MCRSQSGEFECTGIAGFASSPFKSKLERRRCILPDSDRELQVTALEAKVSAQPGAAPLFVVSHMDFGGRVVSLGKRAGHLEQTCTVVPRVMRIVQKPFNGPIAKGHPREPQPLVAKRKFLVEMAR
jgi:hypothetical protein